MTQSEINKLWATRPAPNKTKATAYGLNAVREFDKRAQQIVAEVRKKEARNE